MREKALNYVFIITMVLILLFGVFVYVDNKNELVENNIFYVGFSCEEVRADLFGGGEGCNPYTNTCPTPKSFLEACGYEEVVE